MKEKQEKPVVHLPEDQQEDQIRRLLKLSGGRPAIPEEVAGRVRETVHSHWKQSIRAARSRRNFVLIFAGSIAASLLLILVAWYFDKTIFPKPSSIAVVENHTGQIILDGEQRLLPGTVLVAKSILESDDSGRALLRTVKGVTLRMDVKTRIRLESESLFVLERGAVYLDSERTNHKFHVSTPMGSVANQGTQFEIRLQQKGMEVRVREGSVNLTTEKILQAVTAGNRLSIDAEGKILISKFATYDPAWDWTSRVSPLFHLEGRTLTEFLAWITHENGWTLNLSGSQFQQSYGKIVLHGSVENLLPAQMLEAVLPVCGLSYILDAGVLTVNPAEKK